MSTLYRRRRIVILGLLICFGAAVLLHTVVTQLPVTRAPAQPDRTAKAVLATLKVKPRLPRDGYTREAFSDGWKEIAGCDMRNRILQRDLDDIALDEDGCTVVRGVLEDDPYTGSTVRFLRGKTTSGAVQIDHIVAVSDAWQKGAQSLSPARREAFYNDPLNLIAADGPANMQKGDGDAATWLPANKSYRCQYVARQIAVKRTYDLWVTRAERTAMERVLFGCPDQLLPIVTGQ